MNPDPGQNNTETGPDRAPDELAQSALALPRVHIMVAAPSDRFLNNYSTYSFSVRYDPNSRKSVAFEGSPRKETQEGLTLTSELLHEAHEVYIRNESRFEDGEIARYYGILSGMDSSRRSTLGPPPTRSPSSGDFEICWDKNDPHTVFVRRQAPPTP